MADELRMAPEGLLHKAQMEGDTDFLKEGVRVLSQAAMALEVSQQLGAERCERTPERTGQRNGYRERPWDTRVGSVELRVPSYQVHRMGRDTRPRVAASRGEGIEPTGTERETELPGDGEGYTDRSGPTEVRG